MDENVFKGKWHELKGEAKKRWGKLTDDDLTQVEGNLEKLRGSLQKRYGYTKEEAQREFDDFTRLHGQTSQGRAERE